jgi:archaellin
MSSKSISRLNITLTDQDGRQLVDLSDEAVRITLVIKEKL